jgi:hypothetical protein
MDLKSFLVEKRGVKDVKCARMLIEAGSIKVDKQIILDPEFPVDDSTNLQILDENLAKKGKDYFKFREIQKTALLENGKDALCIGLNKDEISFLMDSGLTISLLIHKEEGPKESDVKTIKGDITNPDSIEGLNTKFDYLIANIGVNYFQLFSILEKYLNYIVPNGNLLIRIRIDKIEREDLKNIVEEFSGNLNLEVKDYITPDHFGEEFWVLLKKVIE